MPPAQSVITLLASLLVLGSLIVYFKTRVRANFYMGMGGLLALCGVLVTILPSNYKNILIVFGLLLLGWGFARSLTIDNDQMNKLRLLRLFSGKYGVAREPKRVTRRDGITGSGILLFSGLIVWLVQPSYRTTAYIFILFGLQVLFATFLFLKREEGEEKEKS